MCLHTTENKLKIATEDIPCFKVIIHDGYSFRPFYQSDYKISDDIVNGVMPYEAFGTPWPKQSFPGSRYRFGAGLIHTFMYECDVADYKRCASHVLIYACTIPKGTEYVVGVDDGGNPGYASRSIVFGKCVFDGREGEFEIMHQ